jgi:hypothetical protein
MQVTDQVNIIEKNHLGHFTFLPKHFGFEYKGNHT